MNTCKGGTDAVVVRRDKETLILGINMGQNFGERTHEQEQKLEKLIVS